MKVILLEDVARVGQRFEVIDVSSGYANNFLFPRKLAEQATDKKVAALAAKKEAALAEREAERAALKDKLSELEGTTVTLEVKADDQGHLFKKIRAEDVVNALKEEHSIVIPEGAVLLDTPIHEVGEYKIDIDVMGDRMTLEVEVIAQ